MAQEKSPANYNHFNVKNLFDGGSSLSRILTESLLLFWIFLCLNDATFLTTFVSTMDTFILMLSSKRPEPRLVILKYCSFISENFFPRYTNII